MQRIPEGSVLGITDFGPVGGTPVIPPSYLTLFFLLFLFVLVASYIYFYRKKQPVLLWHKVRLLFILASVITATVLVGGSTLVAYWLLPTPQIRRTIPENKDPSFSTVSRIEIVFDRPVERYSLEKSISPEVPGRWVFENSLYTTHLYRKLVFYPTYSLRPETTYTVTLSGIRNLVGVTAPYNYQFQFTTKRTPEVLAISPDNEMDLGANQQMRVVLNSPNINMSEFSFQFEPNVEYEASLDSSYTIYTIIPKTPLKQGTKYNLKIQKSDVSLNLEDGSIFEREPKTDEYEKSFTTKHAPGVDLFEPQVNNAPIDSSIKLSFSKEMDKKSVTDNFSITPTVSGQFSWEDDKTLTFKPSSLQYETDYTITTAKGAKSKDGGFLEEDIVNTFKTIGTAKVIASIPQSGWSAVTIHTPLTLTFDQEVDKVSAESKFAITPEVKGSFDWVDNTKMTFIPNAPLNFTTEHTVILAPGVKSIRGRDSNQEFKVVFTTQNATTKLAVPAYLQKYSLSCEIASLRMALNFRGANVSEDDLIPKVGLDLTPHKGNIWGNPYNAFVGNIRGRQMVDGYGVYWAPIAKAARSYRNAEEFQGMSIEQLTKELASNNPVVIWVYSHNGTKTSWNTPDGTSIYAVRDEHAVVAVGFVGPPQNPTQLIINDPLRGQVYWSRAVFDRKWNIFNRAGVVVY